MLTDDHKAKIIALLDAYAALADTFGGNALFLHESSLAGCAAVVAEWAAARKIRIEAQLNHSHGRTYESWDMDVSVGRIHVFPREVGLLKDKPDLKTKIEQIRAEADERIKALCAKEAK